MKKQLNPKSKEALRAFTISDLTASSEAEGVIEGHAAVFEQKTDIAGLFYETIERGAFDQTNFDDVLLSTNHDLGKIPLARSRRNNGNSTMQLAIDEKGLFIRATLDTENNQEAKALYSAITRGDIDGMSFIFYVEQERWEDLDKDQPHRRIEKIGRVREVSAVNFPAYPGTDISARDKATLDSAKKALDNARAAGLDNPDNEAEKEILKLKAEIQSKI